MQSRGPATRNPLGPLSQLGPGTQALLSKWLREGRTKPLDGVWTQVIVVSIPWSQKSLHLCWEPQAPTSPPAEAHTPTLTSRLDASRHSKLAALARRRCAWCRYQRWMVMAAWFTWWINLPRKRTQARGRHCAPRTSWVPRRPSWAEKPAAARTACLQVADIPRPHKPVPITRNWRSPQGYHLPEGGHCLRRQQILLMDREQQTASTGHTRPRAVCSKHGTV